MSTRLTRKGTPMVESQSLKLALGASQVNDLISKYLSNALKEKGYKFASPSALSFLSTLECGVNYASEIARNLGVSRQMAAKTVKELCLAGYLEQLDDVGKQKKIVFTQTGELLMSDARQLLADMDKILNQKLGNNVITTTVDNLNKIQTTIRKLSDG
ncbi:MarR family transcriptional regulator [Pseudocolwellia sp. AS88]|nr:MarR family transcriptional regulator [Pseudocolwellia sp. AS88]